MNDSKVYHCHWCMSNCISSYISKTSIWFHKINMPKKNSMYLLLNLFLLLHILIQFKDITFYLGFKTIICYSQIWSMHPPYSFSSFCSIFPFNSFHKLYSFCFCSNLYHESQQCSTFFFFFGIVELQLWTCSYKHISVL